MTVELALPRRKFLFLAPAIILSSHLMKSSALILPTVSTLHYIITGTDEHGVVQTEIVKSGGSIIRTKTKFHQVDSIEAEYSEPTPRANRATRTLTWT